MRFAVWLVGLLCAGQALAAIDAGLGPAAEAAADGARIAAVERGLAGALAGGPATLAPGDYLTAAEVLGKLVSRARELGLGAAEFARLAATAERMRDACRAKVRDLELATGDDEARLESLYRSDLWYDINHALSAFGYWRAWALLGAAEARPAGERLQDLHRAEAGFKATSVRILYPGLVQGSWLGLGYVALARGEVEAARQRFERLAQALADRPDNPVRKLAEDELTLLAVRRGEIANLQPLPREPLGPTRAAVVAEEAFALLERRRRENIGAMPAGERLRKLIADGYLSDALLARLLEYRDQIVGEDLGVLSRLIDAEYAYAYDQYQTAVIKYREFRAQGGERLPIDTSPFHYHYVIALVRTGLPREARDEVERLRRYPRLHPAVAAALPKLDWVVAGAVYDLHPTEANRKYFERAARAFVEAAPADGDVAAAHLGLAQASDDPRAIARHLRAARADPALRNGVALTAIHRAVSDFNRAVARNDRAARSRVAREILAALAELPREQRRQPWFRALSVQMRVVLEEDLPRLLAEIDALLAEASTDSRVRPVLLWSRLRALAATGDRAGLEAMARAIAARGDDGDGERQFYQFLLELERDQQFALLAALAEAFAPALAGQGPDQRQLTLLRIRTAAALGDAEAGFALAQDMVREFPDSGDAWRAYAATAEQSGRRFEADRAWARIAAATPVGSPHWRDALVHRLALAEAEVCPLVDELGAYRHLLDHEEKAALARAARPCSG